MNKIKYKIVNLINGNNKNRLIIVSILSICLVLILLIGSTYSLFMTSDVDENLNVYKTGVLDVTYTLSDANVTLTSDVPVAVEDSINILPYRIVVRNVGNVDYKFNVILNNTTATDVIDSKYIMIQVGKLTPTRLSACNNNIIKSDVVVPAGQDVVIDVRVWISTDVANSEMGKSFYSKLELNGLAAYNDDDNIDNSVLRADYANAPNLDAGMIPVYYDYNNDVWKKADSSNTNKQWYDYANKRWANAILISDETKRTTYLSADIGTTIENTDISAFYVWIPRFKYRVWNISRKAGAESTYAYYAYTNGIDIAFELGTESSGNVVCSYDASVAESATTLSDTCVYNGTDTITTSSVNSDYKDAWYTHPAFRFGGTPKTGFWMGKFETSGSATAPTVIPDVKSLKSQSISTQFTTSRVFQTYGLSNNVEAHMLTNLEWGAVAYLTHSDYGLCSDSGCRDAYVNNSSSHYTGRSAGILAATHSVAANGVYDYKGYTVANATAARDESKVASTTGNVTGVYDMSGGVQEYVIDNMVNSSGAFYPSSSGTSWNGSTTLESKYYNSYSYGTGINSQVGYNRSRLGDATVETVGAVGTGTGAWQPGTTSSGANSYFYSETASWIGRGGTEGTKTIGIFYFNRLSGESNDHRSFRSSIS